MSNNSITNLIWNIVWGFKFAREMDRGPYFIHQVIFQSKMRQLTKGSELEIL